MAVARLLAWKALADAEAEDETQQQPGTQGKDATHTEQESDDTGSEDEDLTPPEVATRAQPEAPVAKANNNKGHTTSISSVPREQQTLDETTRVTVRQTSQIRTQAGQTR